MGEATIWITFFVFCRMPPRSKKARFNDSCQTCEAVTTHVYRHVLQAHLPWYLSPATACVSCHMSAGTVKERRVLHGRHQWIAGESFLQAWFLLMNGFFLFMSQGWVWVPPLRCWVLPWLGSSFLVLSASLRKNISFSVNTIGEPDWNHRYLVVIWPFHLPELSPLVIRVLWLN